MEALVREPPVDSVVRNRRIVISRHGGPEVLQVVEEALCQPQPDQVRIRVQAAGVSAHDAMLRAASFPGFPEPPFTPGVDIAGVVHAAGDQVTGLQVGQPVAALLGEEGGYSEYLCLPERDVVAVPAGVDPAEAVCLVANYLTAYSMLHRAAQVKSGERILVHGAAGGVGTALLELGALTDLQMFATASKHNHELVSRLGAVPIDYHTQDFVRRIRELTVDGVDAVFDPIGGARQLWRSYRALRPGGRLVWFGVAATKRDGNRVIFASLLARTLISLIPDGKRAPMPPDSSEPKDWYRHTLALLFDDLAAGDLHPIVADRIPLLQAQRAHQILASGEYAGKLVLVAGDR